MNASASNKAPAQGDSTGPRCETLRIALVGPFDGPSLSGQFGFPAGSLPPGYPGAPVTSTLARALVDRGHSVAAITTDYVLPPEELEPFRVFRANQLTAYFCPQRQRSFRPTHGRPGRALDLFAYERECLLRALRDFAPDIVHAHWTYEFAWAALDSPYPALATAHDSPARVLRFMPNAYRAARYLMARRVIPRCRHLTAVSPNLAEDIRKRSRTSVHVVANPIPAHVTSMVGCTADSFAAGRLLMVQNGWTALKNGIAALRAFALARRSKPALELSCFGKDWEDDGPAHRWAARRGLVAGVEFRGPVPHEQVLAEMRDSTAMIYPSRWESCCMAIAEAMSLGLPVVGGRDSGGVAWQLDAGRAGILVDVTDPQDIARGILAVASDLTTWREVSSAARRRAREIFSIERVLDDYQALYRSVLRDDSNPVPVPHRAEGVREEGR